MNAIDISAALSSAVAELVTAAREYVAMSQPLSEECAPALTRIENALSQFGESDPRMQPEELRGMRGRVRELEGDLEELSGEVAQKNAKLARIRSLLLLTGDFAVDIGPDPVESEVQDRLAELAPKKRRRAK